MSHFLGNSELKGINFDLIGVISNSELFNKIILIADLSILGFFLPLELLNLLILILNFILLMFQQVFLSFALKLKLSCLLLQCLDLLLEARHLSFA